MPCEDEMATRPEYTRRDETVDYYDDEDTCRDDEDSMLREVICVLMF